MPSQQFGVKKIKGEEGKLAVGCMLSATEITESSAHVFPPVSGMTVIAGATWGRICHSKVVFTKTKRKEKIEKKE